MVNYITVFSIVIQKTLDFINVYCNFKIIPEKISQFCPRLDLVKP